MTAPVVIPSRSLGALLGLASLQFVQVGQAPVEHDHVDRDSAESAAVPASLVPTTARDVTGIAVVGAGPATVTLAASCVRRGLRLVVLLPVGGAETTGDLSPAAAWALGWLAALGAQVVRVAATAADVQQAAPTILDGSGLLLLNVAASPAPDHAQMNSGDGMSDDPVLTPADLSGTFATTDMAGELLVLGSQDAGMAARLASIATERQTATLALPFAETIVAGRADAAVALVGLPAANWAQTAPPAIQANDAVAGISRRVLTVPISRREAVAMQRLLAREEGITVSVMGVVGAAGLVRALSDDRGRRPRERHLRTVRAVRVMLPAVRDMLTVGPPLAEDAVPGAMVALSELASSLRRWLVEPPRPPTVTSRP